MKVSRGNSRYDFFTVQFEDRMVRFYKFKPEHDKADPLPRPFTFRGQEYTYYRSRGNFLRLSDVLYPPPTIEEETLLKKMCLVALV